MPTYALLPVFPPKNSHTYIVCLSVSLSLCFTLYLISPYILWSVYQSIGTKKGFLLRPPQKPVSCMVGPRCRIYDENCAPHLLCISTLSLREEVKDEQKAEDDNNGKTSPQTRKTNPPYRSTPSAESQAKRGYQRFEQILWCAKMLSSGFNVVSGRASASSACCCVLTVFVFACARVVCFCSLSFSLVMLSACRMLCNGRSQKKSNTSVPAVSVLYTRMWLGTPTVTGVILFLGVRTRVLG